MHADTLVCVGVCRGSVMSGKEVLKTGSAVGRGWERLRK